MPLELGQLVAVDNGIVIPLSKARCVVGRAANCDVVLSHPAVSSKHCLLEFRDGSWFVTDLASSNGIRIDGSECTAGPLPHKSILSIAKLRFEVRCQSNLSAALPAAASGSRSAARPVKEQDADLSQQSATELPVGFAVPSSRSSAPPQNVLGNLVPVDGGDPIPLQSPRVLVGRSSACHIVLPYPEVSSKHCQLELHEGLWQVRDLGSRNGIRVNDRSVTAGTLKPNAILSIAKRRYRVEYEALADDSPDVDFSGAKCDLELALSGEAAPRDSVSSDDFSLMGG